VGATSIDTAGGTYTLSTFYRFNHALERFKRALDTRYRVLQQSSPLIMIVASSTAPCGVIAPDQRPSDRQAVTLF